MVKAVKKGGGQTTVAGARERVRSSIVKKVIVGGGTLSISDRLRLFNIADAPCDGCKFNNRDFPRCLCQLAPYPGAIIRRKGSIWAKVPEPLSKLGDDPFDNFRAHTQLPVGLRNLGATCYLNSALQMLYHIPDFRDAILGLDAGRRAADGLDVLKQLQLLFAEMAVGVRTTADPMALSQTLNLDNSMQQDGQEFMMLLRTFVENTLSAAPEGLPAEAMAAAYDQPSEAKGHDQVPTDRVDGMGADGSRSPRCPNDGNQKSSMGGERGSTCEVAEGDADSRKGKRGPWADSKDGMQVDEGSEKRGLQQDAGKMAGHAPKRRKATSHGAELSLPDARDGPVKWTGGSGADDHDMGDGAGGELGTSDGTMDRKETTMDVDASAGGPGAGDLSGHKGCASGQGGSRSAAVGGCAPGGAPYAPDLCSIIPRLFAGKLSNVTTCEACGRDSEASSARIDFFELELVVKGMRGLSESLGNYLGEKLLTGDNQYQCGFCNAKVDAKRRAVIHSLPPYVSLHLERFVYDVKSETRKKLAVQYAFPLEADLDTLVGIRTGAQPPADLSSQPQANGHQNDSQKPGSAGQPPAATDSAPGANNKRARQSGGELPSGSQGRNNDSGGHAGALPSTTPACNGSSPPAANASHAAETLFAGNSGDFELVAVLVHKGASAQSGHYVAHVKDPHSDRWWLFNDETVTDMGAHPFGWTAESVARKKGGSAAGGAAGGGNAGVAEVAPGGTGGTNPVVAPSAAAATSPGSGDRDAVTLAKGAGRRAAAAGGAEGTGGTSTGGGGGGDGGSGRGDEPPRTQPGKPRAGDGGGGTGLRKREAGTTLLRGGKPPTPPAGRGSGGGADGKGGLTGSKEPGSWDAAATAGVVDVEKEKDKEKEKAKEDALIEEACFLRGEVFSSDAYMLLYKRKSYQGHRQPGDDDDAGSKVIDKGAADLRGRWDGPQGKGGTSRVGSSRGVGAEMIPTGRYQPGGGTGDDPRLILSSSVAAAPAASEDAARMSAGTAASRDGFAADAIAANEACVRAAAEAARYVTVGGGAGPSQGPSRDGQGGELPRGRREARAWGPLHRAP
eukprot:jgi/Mesvir1/17198/Mv07617-RA.1